MGEGRDCHVCSSITTPNGRALQMKAPVISVDRTVIERYMPCGRLLQPPTTPLKKAFVYGIRHNSLIFMVPAARIELATF